MNVLPGEGRNFNRRRFLSAVWGPRALGGGEVISMTKGGGGVEKTRTLLFVGSEPREEKVHFPLLLFGEGEKLPPLSEGEKEKGGAYNHDGKKGWRIEAHLKGKKWPRIVITP